MIDSPVDSRGSTIPISGPTSSWTRVSVEGWYRESDEPTESRLAESMKKDDVW